MELFVNYFQIHKRCSDNPCCGFSDCSVNFDNFERSDNFRKLNE